MKIRHERPMSELSFPVSAPLRLELPDGAEVVVPSWSLAGLSLPPSQTDMPTEGVLTIPFQGVDIRFPVRFGTPEDDSRFMPFEGLNGRHRETLALFHRAILSGKMAATDEVITSLDTPVDLVPMEETAEEEAKATAGKTPRGLRAVAAILLYIVMGAVVFSTLGSGIYAKLAHVSLRNARIEAPLVPHMAAARGYVQEVLVAPGDRVDQGEILVRLSTSEGEAALADVRGRINLIEARLDKARLRRDQLDQRIAAARVALVSAPRPAGPKGAAARQQDLEAFDARYAAAHRDLFAAFDTVTTQIDTLEDELRRLRRERGRLRDTADAMHVRASQAGFVIDIYVLKSQLVGPTAPIALLERHVPRQARGWLDPTMAAAVHVGMDVSITVMTAAGPERLAARISELTAAIDPALSPDFGMIVTAELAGMDAPETRATLPHHMPVEMRAQRGWATKLADKLPLIDRPTER